MALQAALEFYSNTTWLAFGIGPSLAALLGFTTTCIFLELILRCQWSIPYQITYTSLASASPSSTATTVTSKAQKIPRQVAIEDTWRKVPWKTQVWGTIRIISGPVNGIAAVLNYLVWTRLHKVQDGDAPLPALPSLSSFLFDFIASALIADFFLYWGHRLQHDIPYLWKNWHSVHHRLATPTPVGTIYIHPFDAALQSAIPHFLTGILVRPHPVTIFVYVFFHLSNNAWNHSGMEGWWVDLLTFKWLPLRSGNAFHDQHHRFSSYGANAKNYAEMFWIWDYLFGTLRGGGGSHQQQQ